MPQDAISLLTADHRAVERLFEQYQSASGEQKKTIAAQVVEALTVHALIEEQHFYSPARQADPGMVQHGAEEHQKMKQIFARMSALAPESELDSAVQELQQVVADHVEEEENELFPHVREAMGDRLEQMGQELEQAKRTVLQAAQQ